MIKTPLSIALGGAFWTPGCTVIGGNTLTLDQQIQKLFANGEQGFFYDPNDLTTLYQDAAGTIPVTAAGQPVGLMKDKSGRNNHASQTVSASRPILQQTPILGNELLANGDFSNGTVGWGTSSSTYEVIGKALKVTSTGTVHTQTSIAFPSSAMGKRVRVSCKYKDKSSSSTWVSFTVWNGTQGVLSQARSNTAGSLSVSFDVPSNWSGILILKLESVLANEYVTFYDVSVKEVTGYRTDQNYLKFDGVDDKLTTTLPTQLTGCTVIRSVPNVGTQILTGQTIPTIYNDNIDNCGLIVINRALTASETSQITKLFNKAAGV